MTHSMMVEANFISHCEGENGLRNDIGGLYHAVHPVLKDLNRFLHDERGSVEWKSVIKVATTIGLLAAMAASVGEQLNIDVLRPNYPPILARIEFVQAGIEARGGIDLNAILRDIQLSGNTSTLPPPTGK